MVNRIVTENERTDGVAPRSYWDVQHSDAIEGFATQISVNAGETVDFKINVNSGAGTAYKVEIFRLGYYGGDGAREVAELTNTDAIDQVRPLYDESRGLVDAGNWTISDSWAVPADAVSGVYLARVQRLDADGDPIPGEANQIPFIVRNDGVPADIVLQTSDTTWQAYNGWAGEVSTEPGNGSRGGPNFYGDNAGLVDHDPIATAGANGEDRAYAVSYNRPFITRDGSSPASGGQDYLFGADYAAIHWLEKNGYDVSYISGVDTDRQGADYLKNYKAYISVGHDEYWSGDQRAHVEEARDAGVNLLFWSGNEVYWKTRYESAISADGTAYRTLVCYKETWANADPNAGPEDYANIDPTNIWTGTWRDTRFLEARDAAGNYIAGGADPDPISGLRSTCHCGENKLTGQLFGPDGTGQQASIDVPAQYGALRVWRGTTIAGEGDDLDISSGILGYEWNTSPEDDLRPAGLIKLSATTRAWDNILVDGGNLTLPGTATHNLSLYRAESGALVFGAGTVFWSWALSDEHDSSPYGANIENIALQQLNVNILADMGIQPGVGDLILASHGLARADASTDFIAATTAIGALPDQIAALSPVTITGTASDDDGNAATADGQVAVVEVSVDNGVTWRVATTSDAWAHWSFTWRQTTGGTYTIMARAIDDSLNVHEIIPDTDTVTITTASAPDTISLFDPLEPVTGQIYTDGQPIEVGMKFIVDRDGSITELKYYRDAGDSLDTDVREGHLWRVSDGALIGTVTFTSDPNNSGWQVASFGTPVAIVAGVEYVASYHSLDNYYATNGFFVPANEMIFDGVDDGAFTDALGVISAPEDVGISGVNGNGVYQYGSAVVMPNNTYQSSNYWVDVTFAPANNAPVITSPAGFTATENQTVAGLVTATDTIAIHYAIAGGADAGKFSIDAVTGALTFNTAPNFEVPSDGGADNVYDLIVSASDGVAAPVVQAVTVTVTDVNEAPGATPIDAGATHEDAAPVSIDLRAGGADPEQAALTVQLQTVASSNPGRTVAATLSAGVLSLDPAQFSDLDTGESETVTVHYTLSDGVNPPVANTATLVVEGRNNAPVITSPAGFTAAENQTVAGLVTATDTIAIHYAIAGGADAGKFSIDAVTGALTFNTAPNFEAPSDGGADNVYDLIVSASDGVAAPVVQAVTVTVTDVNEAPGATPIDAGATHEDAAPVSIDLRAGGADPEQAALTVQLQTVASSNPGRTVAATLSAGVLSLDPAQFSDLDTGESETVTVHYTLSDGVNPPVANTATLVVEGRNNAPVITSPAGFTAAENQTVAGLVTATDTTAIHYAIAGGADAGKFSIDAVTGALTFNTAPNFEAPSDGGADNVYDLIVSASDGVAAPVVQAVTVTVTDVNEAPGATPIDAGATHEDAAPVSIDLRAGGADPEQAALTVQLQTVASSNPGRTVAATLSAGVLSLDPAQFSDLDTGESETVTVHYTLSDGVNPPVANTATLVVEGRNNAPVTAGDNFATAEATTVSGNVLTNAGGADSDPDGDPLTIVAVGGNAAAVGKPITLTSGARLTLAATGVFVYDPNGAFDLVGDQQTTDSFSYTVSDGDDTCSATVTMTISGQPGLTLTGNSSSNSLVGGEGEDVILGLLGNDALNGNGGNDTLDGGAGRDTVSGGGGNDLIIIRATEAQVDTMDGGSGVADTLRIDPLGGDVTLNGTSTITKIEIFEGRGQAVRGTNGANILDFSIFSSVTGVTSIQGLDGNDTITGGNGSDVIDGGAGNDRLLGGVGNDMLNGGAGTDILNGGINADTMFGGAGNDVYVVDNVGDIVSENLAGSNGADTVQAAISFSLANNVRVIGAVEHLTLIGASNINGTGNALNNVITGNAGRNVLNGGAGTDILNGGANADTMFGGAGNDVYVVDNASDIVNENLAGSNGADTVQAAISFSLANTARAIGAVEHLTLIGASNINGTGNALNNVITGNAGINVLNGGAGNDTLTGGAGHDYFVFNTALNASSNVDRITDFNVLEDIVRLENAVMPGLRSTLPSTAFWKSTTGLAHDADDHIIYETDTGWLNYDSNGTAAGGAVHIAKLAPNLALTYADFLVV